MLKAVTFVQQIVLPKNYNISKDVLVGGLNVEHPFYVMQCKQDHI